MLIKDCWLLYHRQVPALLNELELRVEKVVMEMQRYFGWSDAVIKSPEEEDGVIEFVEKGGEVLLT